MSDETPQINMGPLLDVVFILLIFFMVTTSFVNERALPLERPTSSTAVELPPKSVRLYVTATGQTMLDGQEIARWQLADKLRETMALHPGSTMLLVSDKNLPSGQLVGLADLCRQAGFNQIAVATESP